MSESSDRGSAPEQIQREHEAVRAAVTEITAQLDRMADLALEARRGDVLSARLRPLLELLTGHFALEEAGGLLELVDPKTATGFRRVSGLIAEHHGLLRRLEDLCAALDRHAERRTGVPAALLCDVRALLQGLSRHEVQETELLQEAVLLDFGCGD